jgi:hypothetical protein
MENEQSLIQKKIALAQSEHASIVFEIIKDCRTQQSSIIADTEFKTLLNALTLEVESNLMLRVVNYLEDIRQGKLHEPK